MSREIWAAVPLSLLLFLLVSFCLRVNTVNNKKKKQNKKEKLLVGSRL